MRKNIILITLIIIMSAFTIYSNTFNSEFVLDDLRNIVRNNEIHNFDNFTKICYWTKINSRPFAMFTFAVNYSLHELSVTGYHIVNLIIHIVSGWFVFLIARKILSLALFRDETDSNYRDILSLFVSLLFIVHPIQTQSVTYIVQRMTSLAGMFYLISLYCYANARLHHIQKGMKKTVIIFYIISVVCSILALLSKQNSATLPLMMMLFEIFFIRDKNGRIFFKYVSIALSLISLTYIIIFFRIILPENTTSTSGFEYFITQSRVIVKYLQLLILPLNQNVDYDFKLSQSLMDIRVLLCIGVIISLFVLGIYTFDKLKILSFGVFWFFITLSVESSIIPLGDIIFEHRLYLPVFGYALCFVFLFHKLFQTRKHKYLYLFLIIVIISYGSKAYNRNEIWETGFSLWSDTLKKSPNKARPLYNMGLAYIDAGNVDNAISYFMMALNIERDADTYNNLGSAWYTKGEYQKAANYIGESLKLQPDNILALINMSSALIQICEYDRALMCIDRVLHLEPQNKKAFINRDVILKRTKMKKY
jgi:protein O-mannosyl-transferase